MIEQPIGKSILAIILALAGTFLSMIVLGFPLTAIQAVNENLAVVSYVIAQNAVVLVVVWAIIRRFLKDSPANYGLGRPGPHPLWIVIGLALPIATVLLISVAVPGHWGPIGTDYALVDTIVGLIIYTGFFGSVVEEVVYHGVIYPLLRQRLSVLPAALITAVIFALPHLGNNSGWSPGHAVAFIVTSLAMSVCFAYVTEYTGSVWAAATMHVLWNIMAVGVINVSTEASSNFLINYVIDRDIKLITGGAGGGLTVSMMVVPVMALLTAGILLHARRQGRLVPRGPRPGLVTAEGPSAQPATTPTAS